MAAKDESLNLLFTAKAKVSKAVGELVHFLRLSRICEHCEHYEHLDDSFFAKFIERHWRKVPNRSSNPAGNHFVWSGDPSQTWDLAKLAMERVNGVQFSIPSQTDALQQNIQHKPYPEFDWRIKKSMNEFPIDTIDKIIGFRQNRMLKLWNEKVR